MLLSGSTLRTYYKFDFDLYSHRVSFCHILAHFIYLSSFIVSKHYCLLKKRDLFPMNEMDLKLSEIVIIFLTNTKF